MDKIILFFVVYFSWCNIYGDCNQYDLKFWEADPSFALKHEYNRKVTRQPFRRMMSSTRNHKANFNKMRLGHYFMNQPNLWEPDFANGRRSGFTNFVPDSSSSSEMQIKSTKTFNETNIFRGTTHKTRSGKEHHRKNSTKVKPKPIHKEIGRSNRNALRSTRFNLMEADNTTTTGHPGSKTTKKVKDYYLNPYAITQQMRKIIKEFESDANITLEILGRTSEYKDIVLLKLAEKYGHSNSSYKYFRADADKYVDEVPEKKIILIVHGLSVIGMPHVPCLSMCHDFKILLTYYIQHLPRFDLFIMPMANPDGVTKTNTKTGWNKNNSPQSSCPGVALDRNFDVAWNTSKSVSSCSLSYPGERPFSEPETQALRDVFHNYGHKIYAYINVHAATPDVTIFKGDAVLYPKGYTNIQGDDDRYIDLRGEIEESMKNASFRVYSVALDTLYNWYGQVSGTSVDYASSIYGIPFALEFVMQAYDTENGIETDYYALSESWSRIIGVVFDHAYKHLQRSSDQRRKRRNLKFY